MTHKRDWDAFVRSKEFHRYSDYAITAKQEVFTFWVNSDRNWTDTHLHAERIHQEKNEAERGWDSMRGKDIKARYGNEKGERLMNTRRTQGWWYEDADFPEDADDAWC